MRKPVMCTGTMFMDQRFWGGICAAKGIGPEPVHIDDFGAICVDFVNKALDPNSDFVKNARELQFGNQEDDGVHMNIQHFASMLDSGKLRPARSTYGKAAASKDPNVG